MTRLLLRHEQLGRTGALLSQTGDRQAYAAFQGCCAPVLPDNTRHGRGMESAGGRPFGARAGDPTKARRDASVTTRPFPLKKTLLIHTDGSGPASPAPAPSTAALPHGSVPWPAGSGDGNGSPAADPAGSAARPGCSAGAHAPGFCRRADPQRKAPRPAWRGFRGGRAPGAGARAGPLPRSGPDT